MQALKRWLWRSGRLEVAVLSAILLVMAGMWGFGMLAAEVNEGETTKFDEHILLALRQPGDRSVPIGPAWTLQVARDLTAFGGAVGLGIVTAVVAGYLWIQHRYGLLAYVLASVFSGSALALLLKEWFRRPRPQIVPHLTDISTASFPSGHSMLSSLTYLTLAALLARASQGFGTKIYFLLVALGLSVLIGISRVYLGVHFPTDVFAGWCLGSTWALLCSLVADFIASRRLLPKADELTEAKSEEVMTRENPARLQTGKDGPTGT